MKTQQGTVIPTDRAAVSNEPDRAGKYDRLFPDVDWIGYQNQGETALPKDFRWRTSPKLNQEKDSCG